MNIYVWVENDLFPETNCNHVDNKIALRNRKK
jgi:hypothetical protein